MSDAQDGFLHQDLDYSAAGHSVGAVVPNLPESDAVVTSPDGLLNPGGTPHGRGAKADAWPKLLAFLSLAGNPVRDIAALQSRFSLRLKVREHGREQGIVGPLSCDLVKSAEIKFRRPAAIGER
jgi:hypothetical protein